MISRRDLSKRAAPGMWEPSGGCALSGEAGIQTVLRETREELGINLDPSCGRVFKTYTWPRSNGNGSSYVEVWLFQSDFDILDVVLQPGETCDAKWASLNEIRERIRNGEFIAFDYIEELFASLREHKVLDKMKKIFYTDRVGFNAIQFRKKDRLYYLYEYGILFLNLGKEHKHGFLFMASSLGA